MERKNKNIFHLNETAFNWSCFWLRTRFISSDEPINGLIHRVLQVGDPDDSETSEREEYDNMYFQSYSEELSKIATDYGIIHNGSLLQEITREELLRRCSERIELLLDHPNRRFR